MPLDSTIALQAKAPEFNPLQQALQVAQYRQANLQSNQLQQALQSNQAVSRAIQNRTGADGKVDLAGVQADLSQDPNAAYNLQAATGTNLEQQGKQTSNDSTQLNLASAQQAHVVQQLGTLINKPDLSYHDAIDTANLLGRTYGLPPEIIKDSIANMPTDPGQLRSYIQSRLAAIQTPSDQLSTTTAKPVQIDNGGQKQYLDSNPVTNPGIVGTKIDNTLSPGQAVSRVSTVAPNGAPGSVPQSDLTPPGLLPAGMQGGQGQGQPPLQSQTQGNGRYPQQAQAGQPQQGGFLPSGLAPGVAEAATQAGQGSGTQLVADQQSNAQSASRITMLQNAGDALTKAQTGTGADKLNAVRGLVAMLGGPAEKTASYDEANKYLTQYAQQKAASFGHSTDAQLSAAITGNGSTHISNLAAQDVVKVNLGLERLEQARMQAWQSSGLPPSQYGQWKSQFGATVDPRVFVADQMPRAQAQALVKSMKPAEQQQFKAQYNWAVQNKYITGPQ